MPWPKCNSTLEDARISEVGFFHEGGITYHTLALYISGICGIIATVVSMGLMFMHAIRYSRPVEQRHIIRILFMVPIYALVSFLSYYYYVHATYYEVLRDCYEAFAIASFFSLMCAYIAPDLHQQKEYFRTVTPKPWIWPVTWIRKIPKIGTDHWLRTPRSGLTWFNVIWVSVFQYCFIRVFMTIVAVVTNHFGLYCVESLNPAFSHVWVMVIEGVAVTITMFCLIQFYWQIKDDIKQYQPILKVLAIKLVIFLSFWQTILVSLLTSTGVFHVTDKVSTPDIQIGIASMLLCIEMALFSFYHIFAFSWKPYVIGSRAWVNVNAASNRKTDEQSARYFGGPLGIKAFVDCWNPWDLVKATGRSARWLFKGRKQRHSDRSYDIVNDNAQKLNDLDVPTVYTGAAAVGPIKTTGDEGRNLLAAAQSNPQYPPDPSLQHGTHGSDSSNGSSPWAEVEAKEYFQDQQLRRQRENGEDDFGAAAASASSRYNDPYDQKFKEMAVSEVPPVRSQGPRGYKAPHFATAPVVAPQMASGDQSLPFVTRADLQQSARAPTPGKPSPYPPRQQSRNVGGDGYSNFSMPRMPPPPRDGGGPGNMI